MKAFALQRQNQVNIVVERWEREQKSNRTVQADPAEADTYVDYDTHSKYLSKSDWFQTERFITNRHVRYTGA